MEYLTSDNIAIVTAALLALSEALSLIPAIKANGIFQAIYNGLKKVAGRGAVGMLALMLLSGCTPLLNVSIINGGDESKQSIKGESDQTPKTDIDAKIPLR